MQYFCGWFTEWPFSNLMAFVSNCFTVFGKCFRMVRFVFLVFQNDSAIFCVFRRAPFAWRGAGSLCQCPVGCLDGVVTGVKNRDPLIFSSGSVAESVFQRSPVTEISYRDEGFAIEFRKHIVNHREQ